MEPCCTHCAKPVEKVKWMLKLIIHIFNRKIQKNKHYPKNSKKFNIKKKNENKQFLKNFNDLIWNSYKKNFIIYTHENFGIRISFYTTKRVERLLKCKNIYILLSNEIFILPV